MWFRSDRPELNRRSERGATLTGYSLTMATMVVVALATMGLLQDNSETFLVGTGQEIGQAPLPAGVAAANTQASYAGGNSTGSGSYTGTPDNPTVIDVNNPTPNTFSSLTPVQTDEFVVGSGGSEFCLEASGTSAVTQPCPNNVSTATQVERFVDPSGNTYISIGTDPSGDRVCLQRFTGLDGTSPEDVTLAPCDDTNPYQQWNHDGDTFKDPLDSSVCLDVRGGIGNGNDLITWGCHGGTNQDFTFGATAVNIPFTPASPTGGSPIAIQGSLGSNSVSGNAYANKDAVNVFVESGLEVNEDFTIPGIGVTVPAGTRVCSYYIHYTGNLGSGNGAGLSNVSVSFPGTILGFAESDGDLDASDDWNGPSTATFAGGRGMESTERATGVGTSTMTYSQLNIWQTGKDDARVFVSC